MAPLESYGTQGAQVADCGCGPGVVTEKFLQRGAARVFAIDVNAAMLQRVRRRLADAVAARRVILVHGVAEAQLFSSLRDRLLDGRGFDVMLFKRSLYVKRTRALSALRSAVDSLNPDGVLAVIHGERSLRRYAFGPGLRPRPYTIYHLFNRAVSKLGEKLGIGDYTLYTQDELLDLLRTSSPGRRVESIPANSRPLTWRQS